LSGVQLDMYGVNSYEIYRKTKAAAEYTLLGTTNAPATSFVDVINDGVTVYKYYVKAVDDYTTVNEINVLTGVRSALAKNDLASDFDSSGEVDFPDFSAFATAFNTTSADAENWVSVFDLIVSGKVDFPDFSAFAADWGKTAGKVAKAAPGMPTSDIGFTIGAEVDESTSSYLISVNVGQSDQLKGFEFALSYNNEALEFVNDSINGLVGLNMFDEKDGIIRVSDMFINEEFNGVVTLAFNSKGVNSDLTFEVMNAMVDDLDVVAVSTNLSELSLKALPTVYSLNQNFPNPFNPTTTIEYSIPESGNVDLVIYNMAGQKVRTLINNTQNAAFYKVVWDGRNDSGEAVASGLYFYKLVSGNFSKIEKMTLIK